MKTMFFWLVVLATLNSCKTSEEAGSESKAIYSSGLFGGATIGPVMDSNENLTLMLCQSLEKYESYVEKYSGKSDQNWQDSKCEPLSSGVSIRGRMYRPIWVSKNNVSKFKKQINDSLWKKCLRDQFWFCDDSKIAKEVDAAFSPGQHLGRFINGDDWIKLFWETAQTEVKVLVREQSN